MYQCMQPLGDGTHSNVFLARDNTTQYVELVA